MRFLILILLAIFATGCSSPEAAGPKRRVEKEGGFSHVPPAGWTPHKVEGNPFAVYLSLDDPPSALEFRRDLGLPDGADVVEFARQRNALVYEASEFVDATDFTTDSGLVGKRIVFRSQTRKDGKPAVIRQIIYLFPNGGDTHAFWGGAPGEAGTKFDSIFDAVAKSYRVEK